MTFQFGIVLRCITYGMRKRGSFVAFSGVFGISWVRSERDDRLSDLLDRCGDCVLLRRGLDGEGNEVNGDCNICINGKLPSYSASCVECGLLRKNYVRHGRWGHRWVCSNMTGYEYACSCSECGKPTYRISILEDMPTYCPNCGAKMDGGKT